MDKLESVVNLIATQTAKLTQTAEEHTRFHQEHQDRFDRLEVKFELFEKRLIENEATVRLIERRFLQRNPPSA